MIHQNLSSSNHRIPVISVEPTKTHQSDGDCAELCHSFLTRDRCLKPEILLREIAKEPVTSDVLSPEVCVREKLQRHRTDIAGRVWIPDLWGQEEVLKDWIDCTAFDSSLFPNGITSARAALVVECRRMNSGGFPIKNGC